MFEMYGLIAAFSVQILLFSVLGPLRLVGGMREQIQRFIAERAPAVDAAAVAQVDRRLRLMVRLGLGSALIGLVVLAGMIRYMQRPDWTDGPLEVVIPLYFFLQIVPLVLGTVTAGQFHDVLKRALPAGKRKALLEPRGLFDFVSRTAVALAIVVYFLQLLLLVYIERHPFPGFAGLPVNAGILTLMYVVLGFAIHFTIRRMGSSPLQGREERMRSAGLAVKVCVYGAILGVANISTNMALILLDEQRWEPAFGCIGLILAGLLCRAALREQLRIPEGGPTATPAR